ncbi:MAG: DUF819 family protein [Candidatus Omnitrophica bacterium]|nr:DUF819 family protein [Candidatus Omnitrophota bacterium]
MPQRADGSGTAAVGIPALAGHRYRVDRPSMIRHPLLLSLYLVLLVAAIRGVMRRHGTWPVFQWLPTPVWCYGLPMLGTTCGLTPPSSPVYAAITAWLLPPTLFLLLLPANVRELAQAGRHALACFAVGSGGIILGLVMGFLWWRPHLPPEAWQGIGALAGTWIGGSANMVAVAQSVGAADSILAPLIVVDTLLAYTWMGGLLWLARWQAPVDLAWQARPLSLASPTSAAEPTTTGRVLLALTMAAGATLLAQQAGARLPVLGSVVTPTTWRLLLITAIGLLLASLPGSSRLTPAASWLSAPLLCLVLASMGARANLAALWRVPWWLAVGVVAFAVHGSLMFLTSRWRRWPIGLAATASQANVGGVASAPLVAAVYHPALAPLGVALALLGNALGTPAGLLTAWLCRWLAGRYPL